MTAHRSSFIQILLMVDQILAIIKNYCFYKNFIGNAIQIRRNKQTSEKLKPFKSIKEVQEEKIIIIGPQFFFNFLKPIY